ncbi:putative transposase [Arachidicoccus rhizosphaerae]|uniref:Putative transposase n=1 Tax=Arachidicoccus rhizosphaerae TaxID=551991 RepID=A0A1H3YW14_9BACT|nr:putative transposase [Arachidicoccus rhizosphaerae]
MAKTGRLALVNKAEKRLSIQRQCELLDLPRSSYYYTPSEETAENLDLMDMIDKTHLKHPYYGVKRMRAELSTPQRPLNEKRIRRLMRKMGLEAIYPKSNTSKPCKWNEKFPYLLRGVDIERANQVWSTDITYIPMARGFMYLCAVIDWQSRYILSWTLSNTLTTDFCIEAVQQAIDRYGVPEIINTDQGSQFTSEEYVTMVKGYGIRHSMDGKGRATDNIAIERFWRSLKYENIYLYSYKSSLELYTGIKEYMAFYNEERKHQSLEEKTPKAVYMGLNDPTAFTTENFLYGSSSFGGLTA